MSSSNFLRLLPRFPAPFLCPYSFLQYEVMCFRRQFLCKMRTIQSAFLRVVLSRMFLSHFIHCNASSFFTLSVQLISPLFSSPSFRYSWPTLRSVQVSASLLYVHYIYYIRSWVYIRVLRTHQCNLFVTLSFQILIFILIINKRLLDTINILLRYVVLTQEQTQNISTNGFLYITLQISGHRSCTYRQVFQFLYGMGMFIFIINFSLEFSLKGLHPRHARFPHHSTFVTQIHLAISYSTSHQLRKLI